MPKKQLLNWWFDRGHKNLSIINFKQIRKQNLKEYGNDPDVNIKRRWGIHTNGAKKGNPQHCCLDWSMDLGHIHINYTDFNYNHQCRRKK